MPDNENMNAGKLAGQSPYVAQIIRPGEDVAEWDAFVTLSPHGSVFCRSWWLDAVAPGKHAFLVLRKNGNIVAGIPLAWKGSRPFGEITMPPLTQTLGVLLSPPRSQNYARTIGDEMEITERLIEALPAFRQLTMHCNYNFTNWLPFCWAGYSQTTRYTYVIDDLTDLEKVFANFSDGKKRSIKKAEQLLTVREDMDPAAFYEHQVRSLRKQGTSVVYGCDLFRRICEIGYANKGAKTWYAEDKEGNIHAALIIVYDTKSAYALNNSIDPDYRHIGAGALLHKASIIYASKVTRVLDFMGSMSRGGGQSCLMYNMVQKPYFRIWKDTRSRASVCWANVVSFVQKNLPKHRDGQTDD